MADKKSDKEINEDKKSNSSLTGFIKDMGKKLDPNLDFMGDKATDSNPTNVSKKSDSNKNDNESISKTEPKTSTSSTDINTKSKKNKENSSKSSTKNSDEDDAFADHLQDQFHKLYDFLQKDKEKIIRTIGLIVGGLFIIAGIILIFGSADKVSDNVIFGERAVTSAFLVILGILIIAGVFASRIVGKTSFDNLYKEVQVAEENSSSKDKSKDTKNGENSPENQNKKKISESSSNSKDIDK